MKLYLRVDGGNVHSLGMGHVCRCLKLADHFKIKGFEPVFIMKDIDGGIRKVQEKKYPVYILSKNISKKEEINRLKELVQNNLLITDIRSISQDYFLQLNPVCKKTVYFDDLGNNDFSPHILINPSVTPSLQRYKRRCAETKYFIGEKYFILGSGFNRKNKVKEKLKSVLVSLGGADPANYTPVVLKIIDKLDYNVSINLVLGPAFINFKEVEFIVGKMSSEVKVLKNVANMGKLMHDADIAFVSGGDTALELAFTGTPGFIVPTIDYEGKLSSYLGRKKIFISLGDLKKMPSSKVLKKINPFMNDFNKRKEFSMNAQNFIDGKGLDRVFKAITI